VVQADVANDGKLSGEHKGEIGIVWQRTGQITGELGPDRTE